METIRDIIIEKHDRLDILIKTAGRNMPDTTIEPDQALYDLNKDHYLLSAYNCSNAVYIT